MRRLALFLAVLLLASCGQKHFITDKSFREKVGSDLRERMTENGGSLLQFFNVDYGDMTVTPGEFCKDGSISTEELEALEFLYAYMPLADLTDYPTDYYLSNVRSSFETRDEMGWDIPELIFRHFVLPVRVNNENLDTSRTAFARELKPRIKGMSMQEAILEVNHWCHEKVTYQPSDARTLSPLASVKTSIGRCGEESTFTVAALRSVGIPARQVYTPRWAHTDDNHAWVEAWADGQWFFMGACEPEAVLNLGWFNDPASRALLMHTKAFGRYDGPEEIMLEGPNFTEINLIDNYAPTGRADISVVYEDGSPADSARVWFCIYNYAEFYPAVSKYTDAGGKTFLTAGKGDMLAWAVKDGLYGYGRIRFGSGEPVVITLSQSHPTDAVPMDIVPPAGSAVPPEVSPEMREENNRRLAAEDSLRHAYMATFMDRDAAKSFAASIGCKDESAVCDLLPQSMGNHETIAAFLKAHPDERAIELLQSLSTKDLRDITMDILEDSYNDTDAILCPRVSSEFLTPYKGWFKSRLSAEEQKELSDPEALIRWTKENIKVINAPTAWKIPISPKGVFLAREAYSGSRDVFFVSLARTLGIDARKDAVTGKVQYRENGQWIDVDFEAAARKISPKGRLKLNYKQVAAIDNPQYYSHFTISKIVSGATSLLAFDEGEVDMGGGVDWQHVFRNGATLDTGDYILVSGNRLSDGSVPVTMQQFSIKEGETTVLDLTIREKEDGVSVIGSFDSESKFKPEDGDEASFLSKTGRGFFVVGVLEVGKEPTNHTLNDLSKMREALEEWGRPIVLLCPDEGQLARLREELAAGRYGTLPGTVILGVDTDGAV